MPFFGYIRLVKSIILIVVTKRVMGNKQFLMGVKITIAISESSLQGWLNISVFQDLLSKYYSSCAQGGSNTAWFVMGNKSCYPSAGLCHASLCRSYKEWGCPCKGALSDSLKHHLCLCPFMPLSFSLYPSLGVILLMHMHIRLLSFFFSNM